MSTELTDEFLRDFSLFATASSYRIYLQGVIDALDDIVSPDYLKNMETLYISNLCFNYEFDNSNKFEFAFFLHGKNGFGNNFIASIDNIQGYLKIDWLNFDEFERIKEEAEA